MHFVFSPTSVCLLVDIFKTSKDLLVVIKVHF